MRACTMKPEVLKSWSLEIDYSRDPCLGADQKTCGLWERDWHLMSCNSYTHARIKNKMATETTSAKGASF